MSGIFPEIIAGGLVIRDASGNPTNPPGVQNAYVPAPAFISNCELTALPSDCTARIEPRQVNAIVSELVALAECFDADGPWDCFSLGNLCNSFKTYANSVQVQIDGLAKESEFVGSFSGATGVITWTPASGQSGGLPPASAANVGWQLISTAVGDNPPGLPMGHYDIGDWLLSDGTTWNLLNFGGTILTTANQIGVAPAVAGGSNVQDSLAGLQAQKVAKAGDTMTGPLVLPGAPTADLQAATKKYVDDGDAAALAAANAALAAAAVRYDVAQALSIAQATQARKNINASPFDAMAANGLQINGNMEVNQRFGGDNTQRAMASNTSSFPADCWKAVYVHATAVMTFAQATTGPASNRFIQMSAGTPAFTGLAAGDIADFNTPIEGYRCSRLGWGAAGPMPITVAFMVYFSNAAGTFYLACRNGASDRSYVKSFNYPVAGTWQFCTATIPGDAAGVWNKNTGLGMSLSVCGGVGTTFAGGTDGAWVAGNFLAGPGQTNFLGVPGNFMALSNFLVLPGNEGPANFTQLGNTMRLGFPDELARCQRYYEKNMDYPTVATAGAGQFPVGQFGQPVGAALTGLTPTFYFKVPKRLAVPGANVALYNVAGAGSQIRNIPRATDWTGTAVNATGENGFNLFGTTPGSSVSGETCAINWAVSADL